MRGTTIAGRYRLDRLIGSGGMGEVYAATDLSLGRSVAIKLLPQAHAGDADRVRRFLREAEAASALSHPAIVVVHDSGTEGSGENAIHYLVMELIEGETLTAWSRATRELRRKLEVLAGVADGLARAHAAGIIHRDVKPDNIMVARGGYPKILDFGVAKLSGRRSSPSDSDTIPEAMLGTAAYMSPEQIAGTSVDARSDVFSFGSLLYEVLCGRAPFRRATSVETMHAILHEQPSPHPGLPRELERIIRRCLAREPDERYQSMRDVALDLREVAGDEPLPAQPAKRRRWGRVVMAAAALLVAAIVFAGTRAFRDRELAPPPAVQMTRATNSGQVVGGAITPDGKNLIYATREGSQQSLWNKQLATGTHVRILPPSDVYYASIAVAPDGDYVYFSTATRAEPNVLNLHQVSPLGGEPRKIAGDMEGAFAISPDGKQIAFRRFNVFDRQFVLTALTVATDEERVLVRSPYPEAINGVTWSPDGLRVTYTVEGATPKQRLRMREVDVRTGVVTDLDFSRGDASAGWSGFNSGRWLPDGSGMIVTASAGRQPDQIWLVPRGDGEPRQITSDVSAYYGLSLSSDGMTIAAQRGETSANIWRVALGRSSSPVALTTGTGVNYGRGGVVNLPDGGVLFTAPGEKRPIVQIVAPDGTRRSQTRDITVWEPVLSPDGRRLAYISDASSSVEIWTSDIDGSSPRQVTNVGRAVHPVFFPDGRRIAFVAPTRQQHAYAVSVDGGEPVELVNRPVSSIAVSPDGARLLCRIRSTDPKTSLWRTAVLPAAGNAQPRYYDVPRHGGRPYLQWAPDGSGFTFVDYKDGVANLWLQPLDGGEPRQLTHFDSGTIYSYSLTRDGREAVLSRGDPVQDIVLIRNFR